MSKRSPGPWYAREFGYERWAIADDRGTEIAEVVRPADARLIAAAPELLLLLRDLVESFPALPLVHERELIARIDGKEPT